MPKQVTETGTQQAWYRLNTDDALDQLSTNPQGLSDEEAKARLEQYGPNTIQEQDQVRAWEIALKQFKSPLIYVLLMALVATVAMQRWSDAIVIAIVLVVNGTIGFFQEYRAENAIQELMSMVSPKAKVRRDDHIEEIDSAEIVPGDIVVVNEGDVVPADLRIIESRGLQTNEAALTGESVPVSKTHEAMAGAETSLPPADQQNMAFMGTAVTAGSGEGVVVGTGEETQIGSIAQDVRESGAEKTPLQQRTERLAKWIAGLLLIIIVISFAIGLLKGRSLQEMFLLSVSLAVSAMPAGLPVVITVALAVGVRRMAKRHAIIRRLPAVETLGSTTTIVSDKTGTLTQNKMTVTQMLAAQDRFEVKGDAIGPLGSIEKDGETANPQDHAALFYTLVAGSLNNNARIQRAEEQEAQERERQRGQGQQEDNDKRWQQFKGDPMEVALLVSAIKGGLERDQLLERFDKIDEVPFQTEKRFSASIHSDRDHDGQKMVFIKGAPERILNMCNHSLTMDGEQRDMAREHLEAQMDAMAEDGLRVLAMAIGFGDDAVQAIKSEQPDGMVFVGAQGLLDPPRQEVVEAIDDCHASGIRVMMMTGDHAKTAAAIAQKVHVDQPPRVDDKQRAQPEALKVVTGQQIDAFSDEDLAAALGHANVFARTQPQQKLRVVNALKEMGEIVAVTGDGVNDAPALKTAHLGAAMGQTGTDVAKEASDMVITDDNFSSIYAAVKEGRTAFRNIRMATFFLLSTGVAEVIAIIITLLLGWPLPFIPAQILWLNVVTNSFADIALAFEPGDRSLYTRPPRHPDEGVLDWPLVERTGIIGVWFALCTLGVFWWQYSAADDTTSQARVAALTTLVLLQTVHLFNCRSETVSIFRKNLFSNPWLFLGVLTTLVHIGALYYSGTQKLISLEPLGWRIWAVLVPVAATAILVNELHKLICRRRGQGLTSGQWFFRLRDRLSRSSR